MNVLNGITLPLACATSEVKLEDALSQLSAEEQAEIEKVRSLERAVTPMCEVVVAHTMQAEQQVTPIMRTLSKQMKFKLQGLDFRCDKRPFFSTHLSSHGHNRDDLPTQARDRHSGQKENSERDRFVSFRFVSFHFVQGEELALNDQKGREQAPRGEQNRG